MGLTYYALAAKLEVPYYLLGHWRTGDLVPSIAEQIRLLDVLRDEAILAAGMVN